MSFAISALSIALSYAAAAPQEIAVLPLRGSAPAPARLQATRVLMDALGGISGIRATSFENIGALLGKEAEAAIAACTDDACLVRETSRVRSNALVAGALDEEAGRTTLRLRLIPTATAARAAASVRISRDIPEGGLVTGVSEAALELFPDLAAKTFGTLVVSGAPKDAVITVDGKVATSMIPSSEGAIFRVAPGVHTIDVYARGHKPYRAQAEVLVGQRAQLEVSPVKNRSTTPYILGGIGVAAGAVGLALSLGAQSTADAWSEACAGERCLPGFTRAQYEEDRGSIDRRRVSANGLLVVSAVAIGAGIIWYILDPGSDEVNP